MLKEGEGGIPVEEYTVMVYSSSRRVYCYGLQFQSGVVIVCAQCFTVCACFMLQEVYNLFIGVKWFDPTCRYTCM